MNRATLSISCVLVLCAASLLQAAPAIDATFNILSGLQDVSNISMVWGTQYGAHLGKSAADGDLYINGLNLVPGLNWDSNIALTANNSGTLTYNGNESYTLGTAISGDAYWFIHNAATLFSAVDSSVTPGIYDFSLEFLGGDSNSSNGILASLPLQLEVFPFLNVSASGTATPGTISAGQQTNVSATLTNNMSSRDFVSTTWYIQGGAMQMGSDYLAFDDFAGDWFDKTVAPGDSRTDSHSIWHAAPSNPLGTYGTAVGDSHLGIIGGLYSGDGFFVVLSGPTVEVVPEPGTLALLGLAAATLVRRRRRMA
jgi:hypothetical protein